MRFDCLINIENFVTRIEDDVVYGEWEKSHSLYAKKKDNKSLSLYSTYANGVRNGLIFSVRREFPISRKNRIVYEDEPYVISRVLEVEEDYYTLEVVKPLYVKCEVKTPLKEKGEHKIVSNSMKKTHEFTAIIAGKYKGYIEFEQDRPHARNIETLILTTPKEIELEPGTNLKILDGVYRDKCFVIEIAHVLEDSQNEYEIVSKEDI